MRELTQEERVLIASIAEKLADGRRQCLFEDLKVAKVLQDLASGTRVLFELIGYERPLYRGQHTFGIEGEMSDKDGAKLSVILYADENDRLLELEFIRWDQENIIEPQWETLLLS